MKKSRLSVVVTFFLFALMVFKVSAFHVYVHQDNASDDVEQCELCDWAVENQQAEHTSTISVGFFDKPHQIIDAKESIILVQLPLSQQFSDFTLFGRPPPSLV